MTSLSKSAPKRALPTLVYKIMIIAATIIWGASFVVMKDAVDVLAPSWLIGVRFLLTSVILGLVFLPRLRRSFNTRTIVGGAILGGLIFIAYWFQTVGLVYTTPGKNAFLTATYCVITPFIFWAVAKRRPTIFNLAAAVLCICGVGLVSLANDALTLGFGDGMTLVCGVAFAAHIVATARFARTSDVLVLTVFQFFFSGILGIVVGVCTEPAPDLSLLDADFAFNMFFLVIFASCIAMGFQNAALAHVPPSQAAILLSLESVFGVIFSVVLYGEALTLQLVSGFAMIFVAIILSEAFPLKRPPDPVDSAIAEDAGMIE